MSEIFISKEALCLLYCYLNQQRRLCHMAQTGNCFSWQDGAQYYQLQYASKYRIVIEKIQLFLLNQKNSASSDTFLKMKKNVMCRIAFFNKLRAYSPWQRDKYIIPVPILRHLLFIFKRTDYFFTSLQEKSGHVQWQNGVLACRLMNLLDHITSCKSQIRNFDHLENIGYSRPTVMTVDELMRKALSVSEEYILAKQWFRPLQE